MRSRTGTMLLGAVVAALVLLPAADANAGRSGLRGKARSSHQNDTFSLSTEYTGYLSESLVIDLVRYPVADDATVYVIGEGPVPLGMMVYSRSIYVAGERHGKDYLVRTIVVRPNVSESEQSDDSKPSVGVVSDPAPPM